MHIWLRVLSAQRSLEQLTTADSGSVHHGNHIIIPMLRMDVHATGAGLQEQERGETPMTFLYRVAALLAALAPLFAAPADAQSPERRFALVIGNSEYKAGRLPTAANDAGLIAETLRTAGFDVAGARDLDQDTLRRSIREFLDKVSAAGPQAVSFIYVA